MVSEDNVPPMSVNKQKLPLGDGTQPPTWSAPWSAAHARCDWEKCSPALKSLYEHSHWGRSQSSAVQWQLYPSKSPVQGPCAGFVEPSTGRTSPAPKNAPGFSSKESCWNVTCKTWFCPAEYSKTILHSTAILLEWPGFKCKRVRQLH